MPEYFKKYEIQDVNKKRKGYGYETFFKECYRIVGGVCFGNREPERMCCTAGSSSGSIG